MIRTALHLAAMTLMLASGIRVAAQAGAPREHDPEWSAPAHASARPNLLPDRPELTAGGRKLFKQRCSECHGAGGRGTSRAPDLFAPDVQSQSDGALFWKISGGNTRKGMPSFSFLPAQQRWQAVLFLRGTRE